MRKNELRLFLQWALILLVMGIGRAVSAGQLQDSLNHWYRIINARVLPNEDTSTVICPEIDIRSHCIIPTRIFGLSCESYDLEPHIGFLIFTRGQDTIGLHCPVATRNLEKLPDSISVTDLLKLSKSVNTLDALLDSLGTDRDSLFNSFVGGRPPDALFDLIWIIHNGGPFMGRVVISWIDVVQEDWSYGWQRLIKGRDPSDWVHILDSIVEASFLKTPRAVIEQVGRPRLQEEATEIPFYEYYVVDFQRRYYRLRLGVDKGGHLKLLESVPVK